MGRGSPLLCITIPYPRFSPYLYRPGDAHATDKRGDAPIKYHNPTSVSFQRVDILACASVSSRPTVTWLCNTNRAYRDTEFGTQALSRRKQSFKHHESEIRCVCPEARRRFNMGLHTPLVPCTPHPLMALSLGRCLSGHRPTSHMIMCRLSRPIPCVWVGCSWFEACHQRWTVEAQRRECWVSIYTVVLTIL
jgi:hypothetical protein